MSDDAFRWVVAGGVTIAALSFLALGIVAVVLLSVIMKLRKKIEPIIDSATPIVADAKETVAHLKPQIYKISGQAVEVSQLVVTEAHRYTDLSKDFVTRAKVQLARIDTAVDGTVEQVQEATGTVKNAVTRPFREADAVLTGIRAGLSRLTRGGYRRNNVYNATQDDEMFI